MKLKELINLDNGGKKWINDTKQKSESFIKLDMKQWDRVAECMEKEIDYNEIKNFDIDEKWDNFLEKFLEIYKKEKELKINTISEMKKKELVEIDRELGIEDIKQIRRKIMICKKFIIHIKQFNRTVDKVRVGTVNMNRYRNYIKFLVLYNKIVMGNKCGRLDSKDKVGQLALVKNTLNKLNEVLERRLKKINDKKINKAIVDREKLLKDDMGELIKRVTNKRRSAIKFDSIQKEDAEGIKIIVNKDEIIEEGKRHYQEWTRLRNNDLVEYENFWGKEYEPLADVDSDIYKDLCVDINQEELDMVIREVKSNKAPGKSDITYDFWKKAKN